MPATRPDAPVLRAREKTSSGGVSSTGRGGFALSGIGGRASADSARPGSTGPAYNKETDSFVFGDGARVSATDPSGQRGRVTDKGDIVYSDGTIATHDNRTGSTTFIRPDGSFSTEPGRPEPRFDAESGNFIFDDGTVVRGTGPSGLRGKIGTGGEIQYSDGTRVVYDSRTGRMEVYHHDGSVTVRDEHGGRLRAGPGMRTSRHEDGGTTVHDPHSGVTAVFGPTNSTTEQGGEKDKQSSGGSGGSGSGTSASGGDNKASSKDDKKDQKSRDNKDGGDKKSASKDDKKDQEKEKKDGSDKYQPGGHTGDSRGSARAGAAVESFVARRRGESREPGQAGDCNRPPRADVGPGVKQPRRGDEPCSPTDAASSPPADRGAPRIVLGDEGRPRAGGGFGPDCFDPAGCGPERVGRRLDPFDRSPVTNPAPGAE